MCERFSEYPHNSSEPLALIVQLVPAQLPAQFQKFFSSKIGMIQIFWDPTHVPECCSRYEYGGSVNNFDGIEVRVLTNSDLLQPIEIVFPTNSEYKQFVSPKKLSEFIIHEQYIDSNWYLTSICSCEDLPNCDYCIMVPGVEDYDIIIGKKLKENISYDFDSDSDQSFLASENGSRMFSACGSWEDTPLSLMDSDYIATTSEMLSNPFFFTLCNDSPVFPFGNLEGSLGVNFRICFDRLNEIVEEEYTVEDVQSVVRVGLTM
ncbi:hypothetical protein PCE1_000138 [Barthelona sp. PCE]